jgi:hypothetical protein
MRSRPSTADTRDASAALARLALTDHLIARVLVIDDTDEHATQILTVLTERTWPSRNFNLEVVS